MAERAGELVLGSDDAAGRSSLILAARAWRSFSTLASNCLM
jgi:hypothetical protein